MYSSLNVLVRPPGVIGEQKPIGHPVPLPGPDIRVDQQGAERHAPRIVHLMFFLTSRPVLVPIYPTPPPRSVRLMARGTCLLGNQE